MRSERSPVPTCALRSAPRVGVQAGALPLVQPGAQDLHRLGTVLVLRALLLHRHHDAGRDVRDAHGAVGLVDMLAAGAGRAIGVDPQIPLVDLDVHLLRLRQHGHRHGGGVDAALALGRRHPLHAVDPRLVFQPREHAAPADLGHAFFQAAEFALAVVHASRSASPSARRSAGRRRTARRRTAPPRPRRPRGGFPVWRCARPPRRAAAGRGGSRAAARAGCRRKPPSSASASSFISGSAIKASASRAARSAARRSPMRATTGSSSDSSREARAN